MRTFNFGRNAAAAFVRLMRREWPLPSLFGLWTLMVLCIWPAGEFPINDDWAFALPVKWWIETGELQLTFWQAMTLVSQVGLGALWAKVVGFSFENLRLLVILLAGLFLWAGYRLSREAGLSKAVSFFIVAAFLAFPPFPASAASFMTDVPYAAFAAASAFFLLSVIRRNEGWALRYVAGAAFLVAAILVRQTGVAIAVAFLFGDVIFNGPRARNLARGAALVAVSFVIVAAYPSLIELVTELPENYRERSGEVIAVVRDILALKLGALKPLASSLVRGSLYVGLLALPLTLILMTSRAASNRLPRHAMAMTAGGGALLLAIAFVYGAPIPFLSDPGGVLGADGIGPRLVATNAGAAREGAAGWWALTLLAAGSAAFLCTEIVTGLLRRRRAVSFAADRSRLGVIAFLATLAAGSYLPYGLNYGPWFDRYILFSALPALILAGVASSEWNADLAWSRRLAVGVLAILLTVSAFLTRDFFTWSRARWSLIEETVATYHLHPDEIDGGFEYNNWTAFAAANLTAAPRTLASGEGRPCRIAAAPISGYEVLEARPVPQLFPLGARVLYVLRVRSG